MHYASRGYTFFILISSRLNSFTCFLTNFTRSEDKEFASSRYSRTFEPLDCIPGKRETTVVELDAKATEIMSGKLSSTTRHVYDEFS